MIFDKKNNVKLLFIINLCLIFYSCDCNQNVSGTILDKMTKQPIDSAYIQNARKNPDHNYSDKNGYFELQSISGGFGGCPLMNVAITKSGYEIITVEMESGQHDTIYLEKIR